MGLTEDHSTVALCLDILDPQAQVCVIPLSPYIFHILSNLVDFLISKWKGERRNLEVQRVTEAEDIDFSHTSQKCNRL